MYSKYLKLSFCAFFLFIGCADTKHVVEDSTKTGGRLRESSAECPIRPEQKTGSSSSICLWYQWISLPTNSASGEFVFSLYLFDYSNLSNVPLSLTAQPTVSLFMPDMGHYSRLTPIVTPTNIEGQYLVKQLLPSMPGFWHIIILFQDGSNQKQRIVIPFYL